MGNLKTQTSKGKVKYMARKRKRVHVITETNYNGEENENKATLWNAECLADYFFMEVYIKDETEYYLNPNTEYYRSNTCLEVETIKRRVAYKNERGRVCWKFVYDENMSVLKRTRTGSWVKVFETNSMDEICELLESYNYYLSYSWNTTYEEYVSCCY